MHFASHKWADYVRDVHSDPQDDMIQKHLDSGCAQCMDELKLWRIMAAFASSEPSSAPPADVVRGAKAASRALSQFKKPNALRTFAKLVFDSFQQPLVDGVRATDLAKRYLSYQCESLIIDISIEPGPEPNEQLAIGQITDCRGRDLRGLAVSLIRGEQRLGATRANGFGEFFLKYKPGKDVWISFTLDANRELIVPIDKSLSAS